MTAPQDVQGGWRVADALAAMLSEQGVWADGCGVFTCGPTTGHFVRPIAFCDCPETATVLAKALGK